MPQPQTRVAVAAVVARGFGLHPVEKRKTQLPTGFQILGLLLRRDPHQRAQPVVDLWPVDQGDVAGIAPVGILFATKNSTVLPEINNLCRRCRTRKERQMARRQRDRVHIQPAQLPARPKTRLIVTPERILGRTLDSVLLPLQMVNSKTPGDRLLVERVRIARQRVQLPRLRLILGADHMLHLGQLEQIPQLGRIEHIGRPTDNLAAALVLQSHCTEKIAVQLNSHRAMAEQQIDLAAGTVGSQQLFDHSQGDTRLVTEGADSAKPRVEVECTERTAVERIVAPVVLPDFGTQQTIGRSAAGRFDPGVFVGRHRLGGQLPPQPVGLFGQHHGAPQLQRRQGSRHPPQPPPHNQQIAGSLLDRLSRHTGLPGLCSVCHRKIYGTLLQSRFRTKRGVSVETPPLTERVDAAERKTMSARRSPAART